jgi:hypothetical protein
VYRNIFYCSRILFKESEEEPQDPPVNYLVTDCNSIQGRQVYNLRILTSRVYGIVGYPMKYLLPVFSFFPLHYLFIIFLFHHAYFCISVPLSSFFFFLYLCYYLFVSCSPSFVFPYDLFHVLSSVFRDNNCDKTCWYHVFKFPFVYSVYVSREFRSPPVSAVLAFPNLWSLWMLLHWGF